MFFVRFLILLFAVCFFQIPADATSCGSSYSSHSSSSGTRHSTGSKSSSSRTSSSGSLYSPRKNSNIRSLSTGSNKKAKVSSRCGGEMPNDLLWITVAISILAYKAGLEAYRYGTNYYEKEREAQRNQENIDAQLAHHNYKFVPSEQARQQLQQAQNAILKAKEAAAKRTFLESASHAIETMFLVDENKKAEEIALMQMQEEEETWKFKSLLEIEEKMIQREKDDEEIEDEDAVDPLGVALFSAAPIIWVAEGLGGPIIAPYIAPIAGIIYVGITVANFLKHDEDGSGSGGGGGGNGDGNGDDDKDKKNKKAREAAYNDSVKKQNQKIADEQKAQAAAKAKDAAEKAKAAADARINRIQEAKNRIEAQLPSGYKATRDKFGNYPRDKNGNLVDNAGHVWKLNAETKKFDVFTRRGNLMMSIPPAKMNIADPLKTTIPSPQPPLVFDHPTPPIEKPKQDGCGGKKNETPTYPDEAAKRRPTSTAHGPQPKPSQQLPGCDKSKNTPAELADQAFLHADKSKDGETWVGKDGKTRKTGDLSDVDVQYPNNIKHLFDDRPGHLPDTPKNREQIIDLVKDAKNFATQDRHGKLWFGKILPNGKQLWAHVINDTITNCGLNEIPVKCNPDSGFSRPNKPRQ